ncbi:MAG: glycosyltransferase [Thermodesulfobacteriota bacterium]
MRPWFDQNLKLLEKHHPHLLGLDLLRTNPRLQTLKTRSGALTLLYDDGVRQLSLHSRIDPDREAEELAAASNLGSAEMLVVMGLGLAFHVRTALERLQPGAPVLIVEAEADVFTTALGEIDLAGLLDRPDLELWVGLPREEALKRLTRWQIKHSLLKSEVLRHPPSIRLNPEYYSWLEERIAPNRTDRLRRELICPRFKTSRLRVLLLDADYFLTREIKKAVNALGHSIQALTLTERNFGSDDFIRRLLREIASFRPDFVLAVNHLGFDEKGVLTDLLTSLKMPFASWFVDSPVLILDRNSNNRSNHLSLFVWDADYVSELKTLGYERVYFLPLATDENVFRPAGGRLKPVGENVHDVGFVGDSMVRPVETAWAELEFSPEQRSRVDAAAGLFLESADKTPVQALRQTGLLGRNGDDRSPARRLRLEKLVTWRATQMYRLGLVKALASYKPVVAGDEGWLGLLDRERFFLRPGLDYYAELSSFYNSCRINLNATSLQMKGGLNQRVFDVPASGAFLLTDRREQLNGLFEVGREVICYQGAAELVELAAFYLKRESERRRVIEKARTRILSEHTYRHRLSRLMDAMRRDYS